MTCIVGIETPDGVVMGGDSAGVYEKTYALNIRADTKVFKRRSDDVEWIFGFTSSFRMGQLLHYSVKLPKPPSTAAALNRFMVTTFIDAIRKNFKEGGFMEKEKEAESGGTFLVGVRGRLFEIEDDFQVGYVHDDFMAVGCGARTAEGSLYATRGMDPIRRARLALEAAEHFSAGVRHPFKILKGNR
jgi:hypothetical protein